MPVDTRKDIHDNLVRVTHLAPETRARAMKIIQYPNKAVNAEIQMVLRDLVTHCDRAASNQKRLSYALWFVRKALGKWKNILQLPTADNKEGNNA